MNSGATSQEEKNILVDKHCFVSTTSTCHDASKLPSPLWTVQRADSSPTTSSTSYHGTSTDAIMTLIQKETLRHLEFAWEAERKLARLCQQQQGRNNGVRKNNEDEDDDAGGNKDDGNGTLEKQDNII